VSSDSARAPRTRFHVSRNEILVSCTWAYPAAAVSFRHHEIFDGEHHIKSRVCEYAVEHCAISQSSSFRPAAAIWVMRNTMHGRAAAA